MTRKALMIVGFVALAGLTACKKEATGQVAAVVNGEEVSLSELSGELQGANIPSGADKHVVTNAALQRLIDRKLLVQQAKERNLDKDPEYLKQQRRLSDDLLISLLGKQIGGNIAVPAAVTIDKFIADNPTMFAQRTIYKLEQIQFQMPADRANLKQLEADHSLDAVAATLGRLGLKSTRGPAALDTATTPRELVTKILALPTGEPFILVNGDKAFVSVIAAQETKPLSPEDSRALAAESIRRRQLSDLSVKQVKDARAAAKIEYQSGYAPAANGGSGKAAPPTAK